jgi:hypothetical protein
MISLGQLKEIKDLREVWPHEALDFTPWLAEENNLALLADAIGLDITVDETESKVGDFNVDIYASETGTERKIIIENQLEETNHDHLRKLITYASGKGADIVVWIVKRAREEHRAAIEWLNNHTDENISFFLIEIKLYKIGDSAPAVKFEVIEKPNNWAKEIKKHTSSDPAMQFRLEYWTAFNEYAFTKPVFAKNFKRRKPGTDHWMTLSLGSSAYHLDILTLKKRNAVSVEFYISDDKSIYHKLLPHREEIETDIGFALDWRELPDKKASRIIIEKPVNLDEYNEWNSQFDWIIDMCVRFKKAFKKFV